MKEILEISLDSVNGQNPVSRCDDYFFFIHDNETSYHLFLE